MTEREFMIKIRRLMLSIVALIDERYKLGKHSEATEQHIDEMDSMT